MAEERDLQSTEVRERLESQLHNLVRRQTLQQKESETEARLRDQMYEETASEHLADQEQSSQHHKRQIDAARKEIETIKQRNAIQQQNMILEWQTGMLSIPTKVFPSKISLAITPQPKHALAS